MARYQHRRHELERLRHLRLRHGGRGRDEDERQFTDDWYTYTASFGSLATTVAGTVNIQIQQDADFEVIKLTAFGNAHGTAEPWLDSQILPCTIQIVDAGSGRQLFSAATPIFLVAGTGKLPFILPISRIFKAASTIQTTLTNYGVTTYDNIYVAFTGRKIFPLTRS